jgi:hypothetical protein
MAMWHTTIPEAAGTFSGLFRRPACHAMANMNDRTALATEYGYSGITPGSKAGQLTGSAYVEDEAGTLMGRVSICKEPTRSHAEDDYPCSHIDTPLSLRFFFEAIRRPAISMSDRQHTLLRAQAATGG